MVNSRVKSYVQRFGGAQATRLFLASASVVFKVSCIHCLDDFLRVSLWTFPFFIPFSEFMKTFNEFMKTRSILTTVALRRYNYSFFIEQKIEILSVAAYRLDN